MNTKFFIEPAWVNLAYLIASVLFILGVRGLTHPRTAVTGNLMGAAGMLVAIVVTLLARGLDYRLVLASLALGAVAGVIAALKVAMTAMPQMVALFNGFGGAASALVAATALMQYTTATPKVDIARHSAEQAASIVEGGCVVDTVNFAGSEAGDGLQFLIATAVSGLIGAVTFWGSLVAFAKLQELVSTSPVTFPGQKLVNALLGLAAVGCGVALVAQPHDVEWYWALCVISSVLGIGLVIPIGGADMPVVIALLNSYSGLAAAATGFVLNNNVLIIAGSLVGASGVILTSIMCKAMNRSLVNVLFGVMAPGGSTATADEVYEGKIKSTTAEEVAMLCDGARRAVIVPGYGMAVAQAQHVVQELAEALDVRGCQVEFAIHPVAGRMPGHMNVLLAEADVPYDQLVEMDAINPTMPTVDVALVIGANDVVNPDARLNPNSPIAGMPVINVDQAKTVIVVKRSLSPGFAGIPNPLFAADNTLMYFGDGKKAIQDLVLAVKEL